MLRRAFLWIVVGISFLIGASAAPAQEDDADCSTDQLTAVWQAASARASIQLQAPNEVSPLILYEQYPVNDALSLTTGLFGAQNGLPFAVFSVGTMADDAAAAAPWAMLTVPTAGVSATASGNSNLRTGPDTSYSVFGRTSTGETLNVIAAINRGGFDWLNVQTANGTAWLRGDQARISDSAALAGLRSQFKLDFTNIVAYTDSERTTRCPLPSALLVQTPPDTTIAYDVNGMTLLQSGAAVITQENFAQAAGYTGEGRRRIYFTNIQGRLETLAPLAPFQVTDPDRTFAVELDAAGAVSSYVGSFTQAEQEFASAALRFTCFVYNREIQQLMASTPTGAASGGFAFDLAPCTGTFSNLHPGWNTVLDSATTAFSAPVTTVDEEAALIPTLTPALATAAEAEAAPIAESLTAEVEAAPTSVVADADGDPVDCGTFQPATGSVIFWNLKSLTSARVGDGARVTATLEGGENIPGTRYFYFRVQVGDAPQRLYAVDLEGSTVIGAGERTQAFQLIPGTEGTMQIEPPNQISVQVDAEEFRLFAASGVVGSACDKIPEDAFDNDPVGWVLFQNYGIIP